MVQCFFFLCSLCKTSIGWPWLTAARAPQGGDGSDACSRCFGTSGRPSRWSSLQPCITAEMWGLSCTKAYGHRRHSGLRSQPLEEVSEPQGEAVTVGYVAALGPLLAVPLLAGAAGEAVDARTLRFLLARSLAEKEEEQQRKAEFAQQVEELRQASLARARELHAQVGADVLNAAPRSQKTDRTTGRRPGVLKEPVPPVVVEQAACPCSGALLLVVPSLAAAESDGVDGTSLKYFLKLALQKKKEEEEKKRKEVYEERMSVLNRRVRDGLPLTSAQDAAWRQRSGLPPRQEKRRKRKKRKKRRLPRTSSRPSWCRKLWRFRSCSFLTLSSSSPVVPQRQILMVQTVQQTTEFPQLLYVSGRRCPCCAGRACHAVLTALVCTWLVFLVTLHLALCSCVFVWPKMLRIMAGTHHTVAGFTGDDAPRAVLLFFVVWPKMLGIIAGTTQQDSCLEKYRKFWFLWR